jgi:hypothetical protein
MSRKRKPLTAYPLAQFEALFARVVETGESLLIPCTPTQAASLRGELYAYRSACQADPSGAERLGIRGINHYAVALRTTPHGLEVLLASALPGPALIEAALGGPVKPVLGAAARSLQALRALTQAKELE